VRRQCDFDQKAFTQAYQRHGALEGWRTGGREGSYHPLHHQQQPHLRCGSSDPPPPGWPAQLWSPGTCAQAWQLRYTTLWDDVARNGFSPLPSHSSAHVLVPHGPNSWHDILDKQLTLQSIHLPFASILGQDDAYATGPQVTSSRSHDWF